MKSSKPISGLRSSLATSFLVCLFVLSFTSCQKDEALQPSGSAAGSVDRLATSPEPPAYEVVKIDHQGVRGLAPDYQVTVTSDKMVTFIGRRNVSFIGKVSFEISDPELSELKTIFMQYHFFDISDKPLYQADAPPVYTTFSDGAGSLTLVDYNNEIPASLIRIREQSELVLGISKYILPF